MPATFDYSWLASLLNHKNENVRLLAVKNIAKQASISNINLLFSLINKDDSTMVRREAVSAIGRMRTEEIIPYLIEILNNSDPKIVCQAIRGLLVFKGKEIVDSTLMNMINHENEMIRTVITRSIMLKNKITHQN